MKDFLPVISVADFGGIRWGIAEVLGAIATEIAQ